VKGEAPGDRERRPLEAGAAAVEGDLRRLVPAAVPAGLRERVLDQAAEARRGALLAPWLRVAAAACAISIAALLVLDPLMTHHEEARLAALLDGRSQSLTASEPGPELAEAGIGQGAEARRLELVRDLAAAAARKDIARESIEAQRRLKGWLEYETPENPD